MRWRCAFSYYGGKSKLAHLYPEPAHELIVEPFAGAASYALRHHEKQVWLNDTDVTVCAIWELLLSPDAERIVKDYVPEEARKGQSCAGMVPDDAPHREGLLGLLRAECNHGTQGAKGVHDTVTTLGESGWPRMKPRLFYWIPRISHWKLTCMDYAELPNVEATWFVDPPYNNTAGLRYRESALDYDVLGRWCRARRGQVMVCENAGATWLPFSALAERRGIRGRYQKSKALEVLWTKP